MMSIDQLKLPPHNIEAEMWILSCILIDNIQIDKSLILQPRDFYEPKHQAIFNAMIILHKDRKLIDAISVGDELKKDNKLETCWWMTYLYDLNAYLFAPTWSQGYIEIIKETANARKLLQKSRDLAWKILDRRPIEECMSIVKDMTNIEDTNWSWTEIIDAVIEFSSNMNDEPDFICDYGYKPLDAILHWYKRWQLIVLGGRPWLWKSTVALNALDKATQQWAKCAFFSMEMPKSQVTRRLLSHWTGITSHNLWKNEGDLDVIAEALDKNTKSGNLTIYDHTSKFDIICAEIRRKAMNEWLDIVAIDYLQLMVYGGQYFSVNDMIGKMTRELKTLALEHKICIILLSQLSRHSAKTFARPNLTDLRDSGSIEQDADNVLLLYKWDPEADERWNSRTEIIVEKQREWWTWSALMNMRWRTMSMSDGDQEELKSLT